jgi:hypothetical protein
MVQGLSARNDQLALSVGKRAARTVTELCQDRQAFSVSLHLPARTEQFDFQSLGVARQFLSGRRSLLHCCALCTNRSFGSHRSVRELAARLGLPNAQDVPLDSVADRSKQIRRQFSATIILIDE